ncbi:glycoside hydrolase family 43 protein [Histidinibacterium lentulum]|uniref:glycoside hydrolase family 43 protein n=1 Tax=Histidinibacterium lentulum TaxID=2480588 RepID=UPI001619A6BD|nr:glycoside hydrolase family 43 protein [Histidinibacterium lentulum]
MVRGLAPDPSVIRVGRDYWLATSTFDHLPGIRLWHSVNLRDWVPMGGAVTRPAQYRRDGKAGALDLFAPTLRHHRGVFYLVCTNVAEGQGNFLLTARDPAGDWSDAVWLDDGGFDPSLFFDADGTCYYTRRTLDLASLERGGDLGPVVQGVLDPGTGRLGPLRAITPGPRGWCSNDIEGPHLYRIGAWYYLFAAEGGTWAGHMQTVARSRSPWGPFEPCPWNPVLTHRHRVMHPLQTLGHAELVEDASGGWWALALGVRKRGQHHLLGRETMLAPVEWRDGWPVIGAGGELETGMEAARSPETGGAVRSPAGLWGQGWRSLGQWDEALELDGADVLLPCGAGLGVLHGGGAVLLPQSEPVQAFEAWVPVPEAGGATGVAVFANAAHWYALRRTGGSLVFARQVDDLATAAEARDPGGPLRIRIEAGPERYRFLLARPEGWEVLGEGAARLLSAESCEWFTGVSFALLAEGEGGAARFGEVTVG